MTLLLLRARLESPSLEVAAPQRSSSGALQTAFIGLLSLTLVLKLGIDKGLEMHAESQRARAIASAREAQLEADVEAYDRDGLNTAEDKVQAEAVEAHIRLKERLIHPDSGPAWCAARGY